MAAKKYRLNKDILVCQIEMERLFNIDLIDYQLCTGISWKPSS